MEARTKTTNIDSTAVLSDLTQGKIPVGVEGGNWNHITPIALAEKIQQNIEESFAENLTETITNNLKETVSNEIAEVSQKIDGGDKHELTVTRSLDALQYTSELFSVKSGDEVVITGEGYMIKSVYKSSGDPIIEENSAVKLVFTVNSDADIYVVVDRDDFAETRALYYQIGQSVTEKINDAVEAKGKQWNDAYDAFTMSTLNIISATRPKLIVINEDDLAVAIDEIDTPTLYVCETLKKLVVEHVPNWHLYETTIIFTSGDTPTELILPANFKSAGTISVTKNKTYVLSILHGIFVCKALNS